MRNFSLRSITLAIGLALTAHAYALPGTINSAHPRLYASQSDIDQLKQTLMMGFPSVLPNKFTLRFKLAAGKRSSDDVWGVTLFGNSGIKKNAFFINHLDDKDTATTAAIQFGIFAADGQLAFNTTQYSQFGTETVFSLSYDGARKTASLAMNDQVVYTRPVNWAPLLPFFIMAARKGDLVTDVKLFDDAAPAAPLWARDRIDPEQGAAYLKLVADAKNKASIIADCVKNQSNVKSGQICDVRNAGRNFILGGAKSLALAYQLTGDETLLTAAKNYVALIRGAAADAGGQWSMSARVAALGVIYDWFYAQLDETMRANIRATIVQTIQAPGKDSLITMICGEGHALSGGDNILDCAGPPDLATSYIQGLQASAMTGAALGLLAIVEDSDAHNLNVRPMIDTIYSHLVNGLIPAHEYISVDGGHHTLFAYGSTVGEMIERLIMWRRVLSTQDGSPIAATKFDAKSVRPFIYGLRGDGGFPAEGDNFDITADAEYIGYAALNAASKGDDAATTFYQNNVKGQRKWAALQQIWDLLYFPGPLAAPGELTRLPLAEKFSVAGNVFMRDSWDYANSTLLDFKSTSFISESHQHLDQNSFSVFRHAPLLVDSGIYDEYGKSHWKNYTSRTIAHNSIVLYDANESLQFDGVVSNDGGQWFKTSQKRYPTLAQIQPEGVNALGGITQFENGPGYAFVTGNASKAYSAKLDQQDGFLRSIVYLRPASVGGKTSILVFDRIHTAKTLPATSILHTVDKPAFHALAAVEAGGRLNLTSTANGNFPLVVRNGDGMMTIEPLLPENALITLVGSQPGVQCDQVLTDGSTGTPGSDCRFTSRKLDGSGWANFAPKSSFSIDRTADFGGWRMEISPASLTKDGLGTYQWFLNVLHVEKQRPEFDPTSNSALLLRSANAAAVAVDAGTMVVFAKSSVAAPLLRWSAASDYRGTILAVGLQPSTAYIRTYDAKTAEIVLTASAAADPAALRTSDQGVLYIPGN
ncbi:hypothetical protein GTP58_26460 [Duganella sp. CY15W]|uniref:heparinase II/III domain-containing protein n=1 Tax=Duganella sp. CY15W TaxID=2692172 RepID=UPI00136EFEAF|nr:heparinase II/III family protein [Duganella sp. CY15W]MYM31878.1 hypothetical protein [Duganella sp. CY15W]